MIVSNWSAMVLWQTRRNGHDGSSNQSFDKEGFYMVQDNKNSNVSDIRRKDRAVDDERWIRHFLTIAPVGVLATVQDGQAFINQNLFVYEAAQQAIYMHTARKGRTRTNVEMYEKVTFSVMEMGRLLPAAESLEFSVEYAGVVVFGRAHVVTDQDEALRILQLIMDKYAPHLQAGVDYRPPVPQELPRTSVFRIDIDDWSAKKKEVEDFTGAYWYPQQFILQSCQDRHDQSPTITSE